MGSLKQQFIAAFVEEIERLNGTDFEFLCIPVFELILNIEVLHKGHNLNKKPVGYTADMITEDAFHIGQCGTDPNYFNDFSKAIHDITRAFINHPNGEIVYLFANQRASGKQFTDCVFELENKFPKNTIHVYDAQRIAELVFDKINISSKIEAILEYLPKANQYYKILPESNRLPSFKSQYYSRVEEVEILSKLKSVDYLQIHGISGIGKTELMISLANQLENNFDTRIWLNGDDFINKTIDLSSVHLRKFNNNINLGIFLENHKILLIVDNLNSSVQILVDEFNRFNKANSKCLISSIERNVPFKNSFELSFLDTDSSRKILTSCNPTPNENQINIILDIIKGYPLILILLKSAVEVDAFTWDELINEIHLIKNLEDNTGKKISNRIIGKFVEIIKKELGLLKSLNKKQISRHFIRSAIGKTGEIALQKRSLISTQDSLFFNIHQLILDSIIEQVDNSSFEEEYETMLTSYLTVNNDVRSIEYYAFMFNHEEYLKTIYKRLPYGSELKKVLIYADIQASDYFTNPDEILAELNEFTLEPSTNQNDLLLFIEKAELELYKIEKQTDSYLNFCNKIIENLKKLLAISTSEENRRIINHHIGKLYFKKGEYSEAKPFFLEILKVVPNADYAILQLARIYKNLKELDLAKIEISKVLEADIDLSKQSLSILFSFYELTSDKDFADLRKKYISEKQAFFVGLFLQSVNPRFDHPYIVLEKLSGHLSYLDKDIMKEICESLPFPHNIENNKKLMKAYANINLAFFKLLKFSETDGKTEKMKLAYATAEKYS